MDPLGASMCTHLELRILLRGFYLTEGGIGLFGPRFSGNREAPAILGLSDNVWNNYLSMVFRPEGTIV